MAKKRIFKISNIIDLYLDLYLNMSPARARMPPCALVCTRVGRGGHPAPAHHAVRHYHPPQGGAVARQAA